MIGMRLSVCQGHCSLMARIGFLETTEQFRFPLIEHNNQIASWTVKNSSTTEFRAFVQQGYLVAVFEAAPMFG